MKKNAISKTAKPAKAKEAKAKESHESVDSLLTVPTAGSTNVLTVEPDSLNAPGDLDAGAVDGDSVENDAGMPALPTAEQLGITITAGNVGNAGDAGNATGSAAGNAPLSATVGDTINFPVTVSWSVNGSAILVVPTSSANAKGILQLGVSQESSRSVKNGKEMAQITFNYKLVMQDTGNLNIPAMRFEIPTPTGQSLDLRSDSVPIRVDAPFNAMPFIAGGVVGVCVLFAALWRMRKRAKAKAELAKWNGALSAIRERMMVLKQRVNVADSREWLLELEGACKSYAALRFGASESEASSINLDNLVKDGALEGWEHLVEEFAHARYGGGNRDSFENKETWKLAMQLMGLEEDE
jgi:hypothetical protein